MQKPYYKIQFMYEIFFVKFENYIVLGEDISIEQQKLQTNVKFLPLPYPLPMGMTLAVG